MKNFLIIPILFLSINAFSEPVFDTDSAFSGKCFDQSFMRQLLQAVAVDKVEPSAAIRELLDPGSKRKFNGKQTKCKWDTQTVEESIGLIRIQLTCTGVRYILKDLSKKDNKTCFKFELVEDITSKTVISQINPADMMKPARKGTKVVEESEGCIQNLGADQWSISSHEEVINYINRDIPNPGKFLVEDQIEVKDAKTCLPLKAIRKSNGCTISLEDCKTIMSVGESFARATDAQKSSVLEQLTKRNNRRLSCNIGTAYYQREQTAPFKQKLIWEPSAPPTQMDNLHLFANYCENMYKNVRNTDVFKKVSADASSTPAANN